MENEKMVALIIVALAIYLSLLVLAQPMITANYVFFFLFFLFAYAVLVSVFVLKYDLIKAWKTVVAFLLVLIAFDIIMLPMMVKFDVPEGQTAISTDAPLAMMSADIIVYNAIPSAIPHVIRWIMTYLLVPGVLLFGALWVCKSGGDRKGKAFKTVLENGV